MQIAQATRTPANGASNAYDFQPQTRNPQVEASPTQPQTSSLQTPAASDVLSKQNVRIIVPTASANTTSNSYRTAAKSDGLGDIVAILILGLVIFAIISFLFKRRKKSARVQSVSAPKEQKEQKTVSPPPKKPKVSKKNSKHKRKKK